MYEKAVEEAETPIDDHGAESTKIDASEASIQNCRQELMFASELLMLSHLGSIS